MKKKFKLPKLPSLGRKKEKEVYEYDYSEDINYDNCNHSRTRIYSIELMWEIDKVDIIMECLDCTKIGTVQGQVKYYDSDIEW